jgi:hypothetical protein
MHGNPKLGGSGVLHFTAHTQSRHLMWVARLTKIVCESPAVQQPWWVRALVQLLQAYMGPYALLYFLSASEGHYDARGWRLPGYAHPALHGLLLRQLTHACPVVRMAQALAAAPCICSGLRVPVVCWICRILLVHGVMVFLCGICLLVLLLQRCGKV